MIAIGPTLAVVAIGAALTWGLGAVENDLDLGNKFAALWQEAERRVKDNLNEITREAKVGLTCANEDPVGFFHRLFALPYFKIGIK